MVPLTALVLWTIPLSSMATGIYSPFDALEMNVSEYQNPWPVINNTRHVYLSRVSEENSTFRCVKSRYWGYEYNSTVDRSLNSSTPDQWSQNITLNVRYEASQNGSNITMLQVTSMQELELLNPRTSLPEPYSTKNFTFRVLYSDPKCLILGDVLNATRFTNCSLWFPHKSGVLYPPLCCEFVFTVLCGQGTKFDWINKCAPYGWTEESY
uniref:Lipocalin n=1 Tax=Rhipicephalus zambeziensis TaxID=60191 RepID=A0A224YDY5_9ACAR